MNTKLKVITLLLQLLCICNMKAQSLFTSTGTELKNTNIQMVYSLGEAINSTYKNTTSTLTQGFCQPTFKIESIISLTEEVNIKAYPTITSGILKIEIPEGKIYTYTITNSVGAILLIGIIDGQSNLDLSEFSGGVYTIAVFSQENKNSKTQIKIIKC